MGVQLNEDKVYVVTTSINVASVNANTTAEQTFTVAGLQVGDVIESVNKPSNSAGLGIVNYRVSAANTIAITYGNFTGSGIDPAAETYTIVVRRPEKTYTSIPA